MKPLTRRAIAKQQTRRRVLAAARRLFGEFGYERATIRDIAAAADMSTGAVFASFTDKADLFREIMIEDLKELASRMQASVSEASDVETVLLRMFTAGYRFYENRFALARAAFSVAWSPDEGAALRKEAALRGMHALFRSALTDAVARGELKPDPDLELRARMFYDAYLANYVGAIYEDASIDDLVDLSRRQIRILLANARSD
jgi:AcrR family transcriptional regulator